jgi:ribosomal protein S18 acetylase RimI-like enzyme
MITIFKAEKVHCKTLAEIGKKSFLEAHRQSAPKEDINAYVTSNFSTKKFDDELQNSENIYYLISYKNQVVGYSKLVLNKNNEHITTQQIAKLERLYLLKEFYGLQLGNQLFNFNIDLAIKNNQNGIWLAVWTENFRAIRFYTKLGFKIVGKYNFQISATHFNPNHIMFLSF